MSVDGKSKSTVSGYGHHIAAISLHYGRIPLELTSEEVRDYLYEVQKRSKTPSRSYFVHTVCGLRYVLKSEGLPGKYFQLPVIKKEKKLPTVLSKEEVWRMLRAAKELRHRMLLGMLYGCGLRCAEVRVVRLRDLDFDRKRLHVVQGKGKKDRYLPLSDHLIRGLRVYIKAEHIDDRLFKGQTSSREGEDCGGCYSQRSIQTTVKQVAKQAGILKNVHTHTLRHSYATHLLEDGLDIVTLKGLMGHSDLRTTLKYLHVARSNPHRAFSPLDTLFARCAKKSK
jgi:site-specific recombinase XerD